MTLLVSSLTGLEAVGALRGFVVRAVFIGRSAADSVCANDLISSNRALFYIHFSEKKRT